jgi:predicted kinase
MDLDLAGRADLRQVLVEEYAAASGDCWPPELLRFYRCYRAYVRGKIALLAAGEPEIPAAEREAHARLAAAAFDLARSYAEWRGRPALLITAGVSGSGKSVIARELSRRMPAVLISSDAVRKELAGAAPAARLGPDHYVPEARERVYAELRRRAEPALRAGEHVILDATFLRQTERQAALELARQRGADFLAIECRCPDPVIRARLAARSRAGRDTSDAGVAVYEAQLRECESLPVDWRNSRLVRVDTDVREDRCARNLVARLWRRL